MSDRQDWMEHRRKGIGASESAALLGVHPYISAFSLWESKISEPKPDEDVEDRRADGLLMEPRVLQKYARKTGRAVLPSPGLVHHPKHPTMIATPDALVDFDNRRGPLEAKWLDNYRADDEIPVYIQVQQQQQIACLDAQIGSIAILGSFRSFHWMDADRNQAFIDLLIEKIQEFWEKHVIPGIPPAADGSKATAEAIRRLYRDETGETVQLPPEALEWAQRLTQAKADTKDAEAREAEAQNKLRAAIGGAVFGQLPDGRIVSLKSQTRGAHMVKESTFRTLRIVKGNGNG